jgi:hypothetical protein
MFKIVTVSCCSIKKGFKFCIKIEELLIVACIHSFPISPPKYHSISQKITLFTCKVPSKVTTVFTTIKWSLTGCLIAKEEIFKGEGGEF